MPDHAFTRELLELACCWFDADRVANDPATTQWKRLARWRQYRWAMTAGHAGHLGFHPYDGRAKNSVRVGSRLELQYAKTQKANFVTDAALDAVLARLRNRERHETMRTDRLWADLLSSMPMCFNLFGDLHADGRIASRAVREWWPDLPSGAVRVRFEHSPARLDPSYLGNRSAFDVALEVDPGAPSGRGIVGIETKYHERAKAEAPPSHERMSRYTEVTERSDAFADGWRKALVGTDLQQIWLDHLLLLSMLQHPSSAWSWGRFVLVYPAENPSFAGAATRYAAVLKNPQTFEARTIESLLDARDALLPATVKAFRDRYLSSTSVPTLGDLAM